MLCPTVLPEAPGLFLAGDSCRGVSGLPRASERGRRRPRRPPLRMALLQTSAVSYSTV